eukprot:Rhum_TRINITY_DN14264_c5_g2::Rhum_TRINITY_DN14264_c5_g2_i1::g.76464::m.76464
MLVLLLDSPSCDVLEGAERALFAVSSVKPAVRRSVCTPVVMRAAGCAPSRPALEEAHLSGSSWCLSATSSASSTLRCATLSASASRSCDSVSAFASCCRAQASPAVVGVFGGLGGCVSREGIASSSGASTGPRGALSSSPPKKAISSCRLRTSERSAWRSCDCSATVASASVRHCVFSTFCSCDACSCSSQLLSRSSAASTAAVMAPMFSRSAWQPRSSRSFDLRSRAGAASLRLPSYEAMMRLCACSCIRCCTWHDATALRASWKSATNASTFSPRLAYAPGSAADAGSGDGDPCRSDAAASVSLSRLDRASSSLRASSFSLRSVVASCRCMPSSCFRVAINASREATSDGGRAAAAAAAAAARRARGRSVPAASSRSWGS